MVKRRKHSTKRATGKRGYKKCIVAVIRRTKFKTPKAARKAFGKAARICNARMRKTTVGKPRRKTARRKTTGKRKCKYGRIKGGKRCRKTPRRRT